MKKTDSSKNSFKNGRRVKYIYQDGKKIVADKENRDIEERMVEYQWSKTGSNVKILKMIEERLVLGYKKYGNENIVSDGRDFVQESLEEILDCCIYTASKIIELKEKKNVRKK